MSFYRKIARPVLFRTDPEKIHLLSISMGEKLGYIRPLVSMLHSVYDVNDDRLKSTVSGLDFKNPIGLAAGYDKSGNAIPFLESLGFSHVEIGSVSAESSSGNPKPRLFRLLKDDALIVHYGLQNDGAEQVSKRIKKRKHRFPLGINIVKTNKGPGAPADSEEDILSDYKKSTRLLMAEADYITYNMSCPNTEMGRDFFADKKHIEQFLSMLSEIEITCPVFLKISPLGGIKNMDKYLEAVDRFDFISGFIFNLPPGKTVPLKTPEKVWKNMPGAVSGKPVEAFLNKCLYEMYSRMDKNRFSLISAGGVFSAEDAYQKIILGASLVQVLTGLVYKGPGVIKTINQGIIQLLERDGFKNVSEAVGKAH